MAEAQAEAQAFVHWVHPDLGTAVVEVGAGTGRVAFDGGLADRIGPTGVLLLTDPSAVQLEQARHRAAGTPWVRFLVAPAEALPLAAHGADLVIGAWFVHLGDVSAILREGVRIARSQGRLALNVLVDTTLPTAWLEILLPLRQALTDAGLPFRVSGHRTGEVAQWADDVGLVLERSVRHEAALSFADARLAWQFLDQGGHLAVMAAGLSPVQYSAVREAVRDRLPAVFAETPGDALRITGGTEYLLWRTP
jgi:SAM-dependent methyltransferase